MDHLHHLIGQMRRYILGAIFIENAALLLGFWAAVNFTDIEPFYLLAAATALAFGSAVLLAFVSINYLITPLQALWQTILYISPHQQGIAAPRTESLRLGRELVASLSAQIYQLASVAERVGQNTAPPSTDLSTNFIARNLPLPLFVLDNSESIVFANEPAAQYIGIAINDLIGKNVYMVLDMAFPSEETFDKWLKQAKTDSITAVKSWERVRLNVLDNHPTRLFDLAAYYNKGNANGTETMLVLFDHTKQYSQDDQAVSFVALSVHELRTPLTLLRGYIEAFEEELSDKLSPELKDFMVKMNATAQQLTAFVNNILNVARVDDDQMVLQLQEENWTDVLQSAINGLSLRAHVRGITIEASIAPNLPSVGVDRLSIHEVINNLIDNAIKYSGENGKTIKVSSYLTQEGLVETTVQDFGMGISTSIIPNLFTKFYRDHRNRAQIGGTGLGLYLSKAIVTAHGGHIWVRSKEGEGSVFGFTLIPYAQLADEIKNGDNQGIVRGAHGWIKNHSLYRR